MPSITHEGLLQPFQDRPELAAELLVDPLGIKLPDWQHAQLGQNDLTNLIPTEFRADAVVKLYHGGAPSPGESKGNAGKPVHAIVLEIQKDPIRRKRYTWPVYLTTLRARFECPTTLLVISPLARTATWCAEPIDHGHPGYVLQPIVLGPNQIPVVSDPQEAERTPELAVLSILAHGSGHPQRNQILRAFTGVLQSVDSDRRKLYTDVVSAVLPEAARQYLEETMDIWNYEWKSEFAISHINRGRVESRAQDVLTILTTRGIDTPDGTRDRITHCTDLDQLDTWIRRAVTADSVDDLFAPTDHARVGNGAS